LLNVSQAMNRIIVAFSIRPIIGKILLVYCPLLVNKLERLQDTYTHNGKNKGVYSGRLQPCSKVCKSEIKMFLETL
jgi:hypothetical protein